MKIDKAKLKIAMANNCMNINDLAKAANISRITIDKYFSGSREPLTKTLGKIAKALNVPVEYLIDERV